MLAYFFIKTKSLLEKDSELPHPGMFWDCFNGMSTPKKIFKIFSMSHKN